MISNSAASPGSSRPEHGAAQIPPSNRLASLSGALGPDRAGGLGREFALGFAYWLAFLLLLEPGNVLNMVRGGIPLPWTQEALRIAGGAGLGAAVTPCLLGLTRRFPVEGAHWRRRAAIHAAAVVTLALTLIVVAQLLASWFLAERDPRLQASLGEELARNGALLILSMTAFAALAHAVRFLGRVEAARAGPSGGAQPAGPAVCRRIPVKTRGGVLLLPLDEVDWIESQGNYLALHAGPKTHLLRQTLAGFEKELDPRFVRIHRGAIVRADRVRELIPRSNGDAELRLRDGTQLRLSRSYRTEAQARLSFAHSSPDPTGGSADRLSAPLP